MHPAPQSSPLGHPLRTHHLRHRRALFVRHALRGASWSAVAIAAAVALGLPLQAGVSGAWLRLAALLVAVALAALASARGFLSEALSFGGFLEQVEERFPALRSWIRNAVDFEGGRLEHVSSDLAAAVRDEASRRLSQEPIQGLTPKIAPRAPLGRLAAGAALVVLLGTLWPAATTRSWATLWNPSSAAPPITLVVEPGSVTVTPGASLAVRARVLGTDQSPRLARDEPGARSASPSPEGRDDQGARVWRFDLAQLTRTQEYWVQVAGTRSPRYRISLSGTMAPVSFDVEVHPPVYARMPVQRGTSARGDVMALRGSSANLVVTFDRDLERLTARMSDGRKTRWTELTPRRWRGTVPVQQDGSYDLLAAARAERGGAETQGAFRYRISALPDAPPVLVVQLPQGDLDLPAGQQIPLDVLGQDDLGLTELRLEVRKDADHPWVSRPLARFDHEPREAHVQSRWDASSLGLLPGQSASFRFVLLDDDAVGGRNRAESQTFELRFPSLADMYEQVDQAQGGTQKSLEKAAEQARDLQKSLEKMARQQPRADQSPSSNFERTEEMRSALERQQEIGKKIDDAAQQLQQSLEQAAERQAFDQDLTRKLQQISELMQQIQSPELKDALKKMQQALEKMNQQDLERRVPEWKANNEEMIKSLERTLELLKKLREEEKLQALGEKAQELKAQQDALNREHGERAQQKQPPKSDLAERQRQAAQESEKLAQEARDAAQRQDAGKPKEDVQQAANDLSQEAAPSQREAADKADAGSQEQSQQAEQQGKTASEALSSAAEKLKSAAQQQQESQQQVDLAAVRRAGQDLLSLQRAGESNLSSNDNPSEKADRQTDLSEGTSRVADSLYQLSRESPFISQKLGNSLGHAINGLMSSGKDMAAGNRQRGEESARGALQSLNEAVLELRQTENSMCNKPGPGQGKRSGPSAQGIGQLGQRQSQLNQETRNLTQRLTEQMRLSSGDRDQMRRLAEEQARIRAELEQIQKSEQAKQELLGRLDQTQKEMKEVEEILQKGAADDQLEERQTRILSRLLDAQRSVNRRDYDPQRESRPGEDVARAGPGALSSDLLRQNDRFRQDLLKSELDRYPAQYRAFVEAYLRQLNGSRR